MNNDILNKTSKEENVMKYTLMHKNIPVCNLEIDESSYIIACYEILNIAHLPIGTDCDNIVGSLQGWWKSRSIPKSRKGIREVLDKLNLHSSQQLLKECFGLSLSDQYWIKPYESKLDWAEINFFNNDFSDDIGNLLFGSEVSSPKINLMSPDITSDGNLKKRWKIINEKRCLIKGGSNPYQQEPLNELIADKLMENIGVYHTPYTVFWQDDEPYSICEDFINEKTELVSAYQICGVLKTKAQDMYEHFIRCCEKLKIPNVQQSLNEMLVVDYLIANVDRHYANFGAIRDAETLRFIGMAPIYDNGTSLWYNTLDRFINPDADIESSTFCTKLYEQLEYVTDFDWLDLSKLKDFSTEIYNILKHSLYISDDRCQFICQAFERRIELLEQYIEQSQNYGMNQIQ